jgi:hypothetical protein
MIKTLHKSLIIMYLALLIFNFDLNADLGAQL